MNSWTDKDMNILGFLAMMGFSIALTLFIILIPYVDKHEERIDAIEERLKIEHDN